MKRLSIAVLGVVAPAALALAALALATVALAHSGATGVVKERMDQMKATAASMKAIGEMMKGATAYDPAAVSAEASKMAAHGGDALTSLFPEGSTQHPSEALPAIWTDWNRFSAIAEDLTRYAEALAAGAGNERGGGGGLGGGLTASEPADEDLAAMSPDDLFMKVATTCSACHEDFRQKKE